MNWLYQPLDSKTADNRDLTAANLILFNFSSRFDIRESSSADIEDESELSDGVAKMKPSE